MKILIYSLGLVLSLSMYGQNQWIIKDSIQGKPRSVASSFVLNGEGYAICGLDIDGFRRKIYSYSYWENDWQNQSSLGGDNGDGLERGSASAFAIGNKGYVCLGQGVTNPFFGDLWEYDPVTNAWTQKANFLGSPRRQGIGFAIDSLGYVGLGIDANGFCKDMFQYDPTLNTWTQLNDFEGSARKEAVGFEMGGFGYVGTGDDGVLNKDFWQYDPTNDSWTQKPEFPGTARKGAAGWGMFPTAFICTGEDINFNYSNDLWEFNIYSESWVQRANLIGPGRTNATAFVIQDLAFLGTGYGDNGFLKDFYAYSPILGLEAQKELFNVCVYPNPSSDIVRIKVTTKDLHIKIFDMNGKEVSDLLKIDANSEEFIINRNNIISGTYRVQLFHKDLGIMASHNITYI